MSRKKKEEERKAGAPEWMATYADTVTLLLCFFVLLFASSNVDSQKYKAIVHSLSGALGVLDSGTTISLEPLISNYPSDNPTDAPTESEELSEMQEEIQKILEDSKLSGQVKLQVNERGLLIRFLENVLFDSGKANLKPQAMEIIDKVSEILKETPKRVIVEGHTDNIPISTSKFPSNWELSTTRAVNVVKYMIDQNGIDAVRLSAAGYADQHPINENNSIEGRRNNRRVDMVILRSK